MRQRGWRYLFVDVGDGVIGARPKVRVRRRWEVAIYGSARGEKVMALLQRNAVQMAGCGREQSMMARDEREGMALLVMPNDHQDASAYHLMGSGQVGRWEAGGGNQ